MSTGPIQHATIDVYGGTTTQVSPLSVAFLDPLGGNVTAVGPLGSVVVEEYVGMYAPVIESLSGEQRDQSSTYLVDVSIQVYDEDGENLTLAVEWSRGPSGPWSPATAQPYDRRHTAANPLTSIPVASPGAEFVFVWNAFHDLPDGEYTDIHIRATVQDPGFMFDQEVAGPITVVATSPETSGDVFERQLARRAITSRTPLDFLGNGLVIPLRRASRDFASASGLELVRSAVRQILGTRAAVGRYRGELPWRPDFGCKLWVLRQRGNNPTTKGQARAFVRESLSNDPRVIVTEVLVETSYDVDDTKLTIRVKYKVIDQDVLGNQVVLPEQTETIQV